MIDASGPRVLKGHGTQNDFVVLPDPDGSVWPEDRLDASIDDGDPELGHFSPWSWWPLILAISATLGFLGFAVGVWIAAVGAKTAARLGSRP